MLIEKGQDIRNKFNDIRNNAKKLIEEAQGIKKRSEGICETKKTSRKKLYANVEMIFTNMMKQVGQIKNDSYIKKRIKSHRKVIRQIKYNTYINKITYVKIEKPNIIIDNIKSDIEIVPNNIRHIKNKLQFTNKCLKIHMKRERVNKDITNTRVIIKDIRKGLCNTKEEYNLNINICKTIINKKASGNKKVLQKPIIHKKEMGVDEVNEITQAKMII